MIKEAQITVKALRIVHLIKKVTLATAICFFSFLLLNYLFPLPDKIDYSTIITDNKDEVMHAYLTSDQKWRMNATPDEISPLLRKIIVRKEDRFFYYHPGINGFAMARALVKNLLRFKRTSGASTITMQVARALEPKRRTYINKVIEVFRAFQIEWKYTKPEILQLYCNLIPYGGNIEGVKAAALLYFNKAPDHLSLAEITALCIIPNRPSSLVPGRNNDRIVAGRNRWLHYFSSANLFSSKEIKDALQEPLHARRRALPRLAPHLSDMLKKKGGSGISTHIDLNSQLTIEKLVKDYMAGLYNMNIRNASCVVMNNYTHQVVAYVGSSNFKDTTDAGQVNGAAAIRQPGSTLKPLLYGMCIDEGLMTPKSAITDVAVNFDGYAPENYDRKFNGYVSMEYALEHSLNIPAVKSLSMLGIQKLVQQLAACGFEQVKKDQQKLGLSMILGGCGASLTELTALYASFATDGIYYSPSFTRQDRAPHTTRVMSAAAAFMISETLSKVHRPDFPLSWQSTEKMPKIAWKTGTSYGRRDAWSIGYNKHFTVGVWVGNFSGPGIPEINGAGIATPLLFKIFNTIDYNAGQEWFQQPAGCDVRMVCAETGMIPGDYCTGKVTDYYIPLVSQTGKCNNKKEVMVSADERISYCKSCMPQTGFKKRLFTVIPSDMQAYLDNNRIAYESIPPHNPVCEKIFREGAPVITFPANDAKYLISKKDPEPLQLACSAGSDVEKVYWYINDAFYKTSAARVKQFFIPGEGPVKISCTDDKGRNKSIRITVTYVDF